MICPLRIGRGPMIDKWRKCKEALEKQITKEPEYETLSNGDFYVYCPTCGEVVMCDLVDSPILNEYNHSHCGGCGQKILWEEE